MELSMVPLAKIVFNIFIIASVLITAYTCNFYYLAYLSRRRKDRPATVQDAGEPSITIQLPIYNEKYVARRLVDAVCALDYPRSKMRIMVLDDSDDDTVGIMRDVVSHYNKKGFEIEHIRRGTRAGYKAGALKHAMKSTDTELVAIFDADFMPPEWFLRRAIPHFAKPDIGLVQCKWGHANENYSAITRAQALSLDFHFLIEQKAKSNSKLFMNFNGTAGIWRRECIEDSGGWHTATLVEDLDLSYRAQMKNWRCVFLPHIVVDAELPMQMNAAKRQQYRWAKGSIQCAVKLLSDIVASRLVAAETKIQAFVQLTRHVVFPLMLVQFLALPILLASHVDIYIMSLVPALTIALYLAMGPGAYIMIIRGMYDGPSWLSRAATMPFLLIYTAGISVNNTVAVFDAVLGKKNEFLRTPKYGMLKDKDDWKDNAYNLPFSQVTLLEIFFGVYGTVGVFVAITTGNAVFAPIIGLQTVGFFYIAYMSIAHTRFKRNKSAAARIRTRRERMADRMYKLAIGGIISIIAIGGFMAYQGYSNDIYPLDRMRGNLDGAIASSDPATVKAHLQEAKTDMQLVLANGLIPEKRDANGVLTSKNPVWLFDIETTNFVRMDADIGALIERVDKVATSPRDSAAFHTGMLNINESSLALKIHLTEATPFMFISIANILLSVVWISSIIIIFVVLKRKRESMKAQDAREGGI